MTVCVGLAGCSGSGKTTLAKALVDAWPGGIQIIAHDWYYHDGSAIPVAERAQQDFDAPQALETSLLVSHLKALQTGKAIDAPQYDFATHTRTTATCRIEPGPVVLVEGIHALTDPALRACYGLGIFLDVDPAICLERRLKRDVEERGRTAASVRHQFETHCVPAFTRYVAPCKDKADLVIDNSGAQTVALVLERLKGLASAS